jgi:hypothetical protein
VCKLTLGLGGSIALRIVEDSQMREIAITGDPCNQCVNSTCCKAKVAHVFEIEVTVLEDL